MNHGYNAVEKKFGSIFITRIGNPVETEKRWRHRFDTLVDENKALVNVSDNNNYVSVSFKEAL